MLWIHRWIGLLIGLPLLVTTVTGILLIFRSPIDRIMNPELYVVTAGSIPLETVRATLETAQPGRGVQSLALPGEHRPTLIATWISPPGQPRLQAIIDPGTGRIMATRDPADTFTAIVLDLHRRLMLGTTGDWIIGIVGMLLSAAFLTGTYLWLASSRRWKLGLRRTNGKLLTYDLHRLSGVIALPIGLLIAISGVFLSFPSFRVLLGAPPRPAAPAAAMEGRKGDKGDKPAGEKPKPIEVGSWDALIAAADGPATLLQFPRKSGDPVTVRMADGGNRQLDPVTMEIKKRQDGRNLNGWLLPLHTGELGVAEPVTMAAYSLTGLGIAVLAVTGFLWWRLRPKVSGPTP